MADIQITRKHGLGLETARANLQKLADELQQKYGVKGVWDGDTCNLSGTGLKSGAVKVAADTVTVEITLGMLGKAMKGKIEEGINARIDKVLS